MANNVIVKTLLRSVMPTVQKFVESGKIDTLFRELKQRYAEGLSDPENSVEILITTEDDGLEYVSVVELDPVELHIVKIMDQQSLSELITTLFLQAEI